MSATVRILVSNYTGIAVRNEIDNRLIEKIDLDRAVYGLTVSGELTDLERHVLAVASLGHSKTSGSKELGLSRKGYSFNLNSACRKIAKFLGWEYSDTKTMMMVKVKLGRELTDDEMENLGYFLSRYSANYPNGAVLSDTDR